MREYTGIVVSTKMARTVVVERVIAHAHPLYKKKVQRRRRIKVHSELPLTVGDRVKFVPTRPISKDKHYRVTDKIT